MSPRAAINRVEAAILAAGGTFHQHGTDRFRSIGVCHGGHRSESLSITYDPEHGRVNFHCFAACERDVILGVLGLTNADRYDEPRRRDGIDIRPLRIVRPAPLKPEPVTFESAPFGWRPKPDTWMPCGHPKVAEYLYADAASRVAFGVCRCEHKCFAQWRPDPEARGCRRWRTRETDKHGNVIGTVAPLPYQLPQLLAAVADERVIWICEGEKDVLAVVQRPGLVATCNAGGASTPCSGKWTEAHAAYLTGADVVVVADRDQAGEQHAAHVVDTLMPTARSIEVVQAAHGNDASDHFAAGGHSGNFLSVWTPKPYLAPVEAS